MTALSSDVMTGKVVLVSGATQGVGARIAVRAAECGAEAVVIGGRDVPRGEAVADEIHQSGSQGLFVAGDVGVVEQATNLVRQTIESFGRVDCVVNCAATTSRGSLTDTTPELFDQHVNVNLKGPFFIMQAAARDMLDRAAGGSVVNILSISSHGGQPYLAPYVASKSGLAGLTKNLAHAHRFDRIRINGVNIGWTLTEGEDVLQRTVHGATDGWVERAGASLPMGRLGRPDEIADFIVYLMSDQSGVVTGSIIDWDQVVIGGYD